MCRWLPWLYKSVALAFLWLFLSWFPHRALHVSSVCPCWLPLHLINHHWPPSWCTLSFDWSAVDSTSSSQMWHGYNGDLRRCTIPPFPPAAGAQSAETSCSLYTSITQSMKGKKDLNHRIRVAMKPGDGSVHIWTIRSFLQANTWDFCEHGPWRAACCGLLCADI